MRREGKIQEGANALNTVLCTRSFRSCLRRRKACLCVCWFGWLAVFLPRESKGIPREFQGNPREAEVDVFGSDSAQLIFDPKPSPSLESQVSTSVHIFLAGDSCPEEVLRALSRNTALGNVHLLLSSAYGAQQCKLLSLPPTTTLQVLANCETWDARCHQNTLPKYFTDTKDCPGVFFCIECSAMQVHLARTYCVLQVIDMKLQDFKQMLWIQTLHLQDPIYWKVTNFALTVVTTCREDKLRALLSDIQEATYFGDSVDLHIAVEAGATSSCLQYVRHFEWSHGEKRISQRIQPSAGPHVAVPEAIVIGTEWAQVLLEDDVRVSPQFYAWLKFATLQFRFCKLCAKERIFSVSLYTPRVVETGPHSRSKLDLGDLHVRTGDIFLYEVPCSWGAAFFATPWLFAFNYFEKRLQGQPVADIADSRVNGWRGSWKKWLIELGYYKHWATVYPYFKNETSFSTNTLGVGEHIKEITEEMIANYTVPLFQDVSWYESLQHKRIFENSNLHRINLRGSPVGLE